MLTQILRVSQSHDHFNIVFKDGRFACYDIACSYDQRAFLDSVGLVFWAIFPGGDYNFLKSLCIAGIITDKQMQEQFNLIKADQAEREKELDLAKFVELKQKYNL